MSTINETNLLEYTIRMSNSKQEEAHARAAHAIWNHGRSWEDFWRLACKEREEASWGTNGKLLTWVLVRKDDIEGEIYAGCETYRREGWVKRRGQVDDVIEDTYVYGIASVVTPKQHLRRGYATRLLSLLHYQLGESVSFPTTWGEAPPSPPIDLVPRSIGSILWSDVGSKFYAKCSVTGDRAGWVVDDTQSSELVWKILPSSSTNTEGGSYEWIYEDDMPSISERLSSEVKERLRKADSTKASIYMQDPSSEGTLTFAAIKGNWYRPPKTQPFPLGIKIRGDDGEREREDAIVLFTLSNQSIGLRLLISYISHLEVDQLHILLNALDGIATEEGLSEGWIWDINPSSELIKAWKGQEGREVKIGKRPEIDGHLLGVAWYGNHEAKLLDGQMWSWC